MSSVNDIEKLIELRNNNKISEEEYQKLKSKIINGDNPISSSRKSLGNKVHATAPTQNNAGYAQMMVTGIILIIIGASFFTDYWAEVLISAIVSGIIMKVIQFFGLRNSTFLRAAFLVSLVTISIYAINNNDSNSSYIPGSSGAQFCIKHDRMFHPNIIHEGCPECENERVLKILE